MDALRKEMCVLKFRKKMHTKPEKNIKIFILSFLLIRMEREMLRLLQI